MKKSELKQIIKEEIKKILYKESFESSTLAQIMPQLRATGVGNLPKGIQWDKIPESAVETGQSGTPQMNKIINDTNYMVIWYTDKKQIAKYKPTTYSKWGSKRDNSTYLNPGKLIMTRGKNFLYGYGDLLTYKVASDKYSKPLDGEISVTALNRDLELNTIILDMNELKKYNASGIRQDRKINQSGATALMKASDILRNNKDRYEKALRKIKNSKLTKEVDDKVEQALKELSVKIENASNMTMKNLITYKDHENYYDSSLNNKNIKNIEMHKIDYSELENLVRLYKDIIYSYDKYIDYVSYGDIKIADEKKQEILNYIKQI